MSGLERSIANSIMIDEMDTQEFWDKNWPIIKSIKLCQAILDERLHYFKQNKYKRNDAFLLILIGDLIWQNIQGLSSIKFTKMSEKIKDNEEIEIINSINHIFHLHSAIRHPDNVNLKEYPFLFDNPWPQFEGERLEAAANSLCKLLDCFVDRLTPTGWENDIKRKSEMSKIAENHNN